MALALALADLSPCDACHWSSLQCCHSGNICSASCPAGPLPGAWHLVSAALQLLLQLLSRPAQSHLRPHPAPWPLMTAAAVQGKVITENNSKPQLSEGDRVALVTPWWGLPAGTQGSVTWPGKLGPSLGGSGSLILLLSCFCPTSLSEDLLASPKTRHAAGAQLHADLTSQPLLCSLPWQRTCNSPTTGKCFYLHPRTRTCFEDQFQIPSLWSKKGQRERGGRKPGLGSSGEREGASREPPQQHPHLPQSPHWAGLVDLGVQGGTGTCPPPELDTRPARLWRTCGTRGALSLKGGCSPSARTWPIRCTARAAFWVRPPQDFWETEILELEP